MKTYNWEIKIVSSHTSPLNRQVTEAMRISRENKADILNSKNEFGANNLAEIEVRYGSKIATNNSKSKPAGKKRKRAQEESPDEDDDNQGGSPKYHRSIPAGEQEQQITNHQKDMRPTGKPPEEA